MGIQKRIKVTSNIIVARSDLLKKVSDPLSREMLRILLDSPESINTEDIAKRIKRNSEEFSTLSVKVLNKRIREIARQIQNLSFDNTKHRMTIQKFFGGRENFLFLRNHLIRESKGNESYLFFDKKSLVNHKEKIPNAKPPVLGQIYYNGRRINKEKFQSILKNTIYLANHYSYSLEDVQNCKILKIGKDKKVVKIYNSKAEAIQEENMNTSALKDALDTNKRYMGYYWKRRGTKGSRKIKQENLLLKSGEIEIFYCDAFALGNHQRDNNTTKGYAIIKASNADYVTEVISDDKDSDNNLWELIAISKTLDKIAEEKIDKKIIIRGDNLSALSIATSNVSLERLNSKGKEYTYYQKIQERLEEIGKDKISFEYVSNAHNPADLVCNSLYPKRKKNGKSKMSDHIRTHG